MDQVDQPPAQPLQSTQLAIVYPSTRRSRRPHLPWAIRHLVVIALGASIGLLASYSIRYIGM